jgi:hypothetical protein
MDVLDPREVEGHQNKVPVNRMIEGAIRGVMAREKLRAR